jgi:hypothetical protein
MPFVNEVVARTRPFDPGSPSKPIRALRIGSTTIVSNNFDDTWEVLGPTTEFVCSILSFVLIDLLALIPSAEVDYVKKEDSVTLPASSAPAAGSSLYDNALPIGV